MPIFIKTGEPLWLQLSILLSQTLDFLFVQHCNLLGQSHDHVIKIRPR